MTTTSEYEGPPKRLLLLPADADTKMGIGNITKDTPTPIYGDGDGLLDPGVRDAVELHEDEGGKWYPNSHRTRLLEACSMACKDMLTMAGAIDTTDPWKVRRQTALLATPLASLCVNTTALYNSLAIENQERPKWPQADRDLYYKSGRRLNKKHKNGPIHLLLRNKLTAHHDLDMLKPGAPVLPPLADVLLPPMADSLFVLTLALNYRRVFTWKRRPHDAPNDEIEVMTEYPLAMKIKLDAGGIFQSMGDSSTIAVDPRKYAIEPVHKSIGLYNLLASSAQPEHPVIWMSSR